MGRMSFTQELKKLGRASEMMDAEACWREALCLHRELGRTENALGRAAWTMRYGKRGELRAVLRNAAAETLREARRAASDYNRDRLRRAVSCYLRLAECGYSDVAELMLREGERSSGHGTQTRARREFVHAAAEVRFIGEPLPAWNGRRRRGRGRRRNRGRTLAAA